MNLMVSMSILTKVLFSLRVEMVLTYNSLYPWSRQYSWVSRLLHALQAVHDCFT